MSSVFLTKDQLLDPTIGRKKAEVEIPELGGKVRLLEPSGGCILRVKELQKRQKAGDAGAEVEIFKELLSSGLIDQQNRPLFDMTTVPAFLEAIPLAAAGRLVEEINKLMQDEEKPEGNPSLPSPSGA